MYQMNEPSFHLSTLCSEKCIEIDIENYDKDFILSKDVCLDSSKLPSQATEKPYKYKVIYSKVFNLPSLSQATEKPYNLPSPPKQVIDNVENTPIYNPYPEYNSIILTPENELLCVAPPSMVSLEDLFLDLPPICYKDISTNPPSLFRDKYIANELIEGTMVNLFYDFRYQTWEIATRTSVGGNYWYTRTEYKDLPSNLDGFSVACEDKCPTKYINDKIKNTSQKTFRQMFLDAIHIFDGGMANPIDDINDFFQMYNKDYCYNFVLQHPENHIVLPIVQPVLYMISAYKIRGFSGSVKNTTTVSFVPISRSSPYLSNDKMDLPEESIDNLTFIQKHKEKYMNIFFPLYVCPPLLFSSQIMEDYTQQIIEKENLSSQATANLSSPSQATEKPSKVIQEIGRMESKLKEQSRECPVGIMVTCLKTGRRTVIMNEIYEMIKNIRGNHSNLQYQFFELQQKNKIDEFLSFFPKYENTFLHFSKQYQNFVTKTHQTYFSYYIKKERELEKKYFIHASKIHHEIHIPEKRVIKRSVVLEYFNKMTPSQLMYYMVNYPKEK